MGQETLSVFSALFTFYNYSRAVIKSVTNMELL